MLDLFREGCLWETLDPNIAELFITEVASHVLLKTPLTLSLFTETNTPLVRPKKDSAIADHETQSVGEPKGEQVTTLDMDDDIINLLLICRSWTAKVRQEIGCSIQNWTVATWNATVSMIGTIGEAELVEGKVYSRMGTRFDEEVVKPHKQY